MDSRVIGEEPWERVESHSYFLLNRFFQDRKGLFELRLGFFPLWIRNRFAVIVYTIPFSPYLLQKIPVQPEFRMFDAEIGKKALVVLGSGFVKKDHGLGADPYGFVMQGVDVHPSRIFFRQFSGQSFR